jgi:hypothetical protein
MEENLFLEETQKNVLQAQDDVEHNISAASTFPGGYSSYGDGEDNT